MEFLKDVLGVDLYNQVAEALKGHEKDIKIANLATGDYVSKGKYDSDLQARDTRIAELTKEVQDYDGVDVKKLQQDVADWQKKYTDDIEAERIASKVQLEPAQRRHSWACWTLTRSQSETMEKSKDSTNRSQTSRRKMTSYLQRHRSQRLR